MAMVWAHLIQRRWLLGLNAIIACFLFIAILGYPPARRLPELIRWQEVKDFEEPQEILTCLPKINIFFLKTHKCASSSVQNILLRHAHQKNLTVAIPLKPKSNIFSNLKPFRKEMIAGAPWENLGYNMMCHHMIFHEVEIGKIMPFNTIYISIVRNPVSLFESLYEYSKLEDFYKMNIEEYARATRNASLLSKIKVRANGIGRNPMLYDFGVSPRSYNSRKAIEGAIRKIDARFDFVMISEYFDESIVILRHILCWDLDDMVSLTVNARMPMYKKNLTKESMDNLQRWNWGDHMLYKHFRNKFEITVKEFGEERLAKEVSELRERREKWFQNCVEEEVEAKNLTAYKIWSSKVVGYKLKANNTNNICADLVKPENYFTSEIRQHQIIRALEKGSPKAVSLYRMLDLSVLKGKEFENAKKVLREYIKQRRLKSPVAHLKIYGKNRLK